MLLQTELMLEDKWWKCSNGLYIVQLHLVPSAETPGDWHIGYLALHSQLKTPSAGTPELDWSSKLVHLAPRLTLAAQLLLDQAREPKATSGIHADHTSANKANNVNALLNLAPEETARYCQVHRAHGITVTALMLTLLALAEIESTLQVVLKSGNGELTAKNIGAYEQASHFLFGFYFINHRHKLPGEYATLEDGTLLFGCEGSNLLFDMMSMRKAIQFDKQTGNIQHTTTDKVLWDRIIVIPSQSALRYSDWTTVFQREGDWQFALDEGLHNNTAFHLRVPVMSSIGDYHGMDILNPFIPETGALAKELAKWLSQENMDLYAGIFKEWLDISES
ncbi:hypothetical protein ARMGADRAFT_1020585, partial [Armillaria gallica]